MKTTFVIEERETGMTDRLRVPIDRATWVNGRYGIISDHMGESALLNDMGCQCCLGKLGNVLGVDEMDGVGMPCDLPDNDWPQRLSDGSGNKVGDSEATLTYRKWEDIFAYINDAKNVPDDIREAWIAEGFRTVLDCEADFFGEYPEVT